MRFERFVHPSTRSAKRAAAEPAAAPAGMPLHVALDGIRKQALETGRNRLLVTAVLFALAFSVVGGRLVELSVLAPVSETAGPRLARAKGPVAGRADIIDRNGVLLATSLPTAALYANPAHILDVAEAARSLARVLPNLDEAAVRRKLSGSGSFVWIERNLTPKEEFAVNALGFPGLNFTEAERRVYPHGRLAAHVLGLTDIDGKGLSGVEGYFDHALRAGADFLKLSIDIRAQAIVREELAASLAEFSAAGAAGLILDARSGEILAMVSLPDFDPNHSATAQGEAAFNRATKGVYEMGSTFKLFTAAMALDSGVVRLGDSYDASKPIRVARFTISDYHGENRRLTIPEIIVHSSNIGAAKMAIDVGTATQRAYLGRLGLLDSPTVELLEVGRPLTPVPWREINTMTISYGHGIAVSPLQLVTGVAAVANGGVMHQPTLVKLPDGATPKGHRVLKGRTSAQMRQLMRLVVLDGTGRRADVPGYGIGGKTGTADKPRGGGYRDQKVISSFVGAFPIDDPRYVVMALLDEPTGTKATFGYATGGWVAAPAVRRIVARIGPMFGMKPALQDAPLPSEVVRLVEQDRRGTSQGARRETE